MWRRELIYTFYKDRDTVAKVIHSDSEYIIEYYFHNSLFYSESFPGKSVHYVRSAADNWTLGIKKLPEGVEPAYEQDDGPITDEQIKQIEESIAVSDIVHEPHELKNWPFPDSDMSVQTLYPQPGWPFPHK